MESGRSAIRRGDRVRLGVAGVVTVVAILMLIVSRQGDDTGGAASPSEQRTTAEPTSEPTTKTPLPTTAPPTTQPTPSPRLDKCPPATLACVDLERRETWLQADGKIIHGPVPMEPGTDGMATPRGTFAVEWKDKEHISGEYGDPMPFSVFFAPGGIAFHEGSLTSPSHGCVHLRHSDAAHYFDALQPGDQVTVF